MKLHKYEDAETVFLHSLTLNDKYYPSLINICSIYQAVKDHKKQLSFALKAVEVNMKSSMAFNNLSTALSTFNQSSKSVGTKIKKFVTIILSRL
jgi:tetratricopeptide (TPR) repeat protein